MNPEKLKRLKAAGWQAGSAADFLELNQEEAALVDLKLTLITAVKQTRLKKQLSQSDLAQRMKSSQSRVAKIEAGDASVSPDLIVKALFTIGATRQEIQRAIVSKLPVAA